MDYKSLSYFVCIADLKSFSRAGSALGLAQPTLSRHIALLEADLGHRVFERHGRGVALTEAGAALLVHARHILNTAQAAREELNALDKSPPGRITIGLPPRVSLAISAKLVERFRRRLPRALISIIEAPSPHLRERLLAGQLDLAILFDPPPSPLLTYSAFLQEALILVAPAQGKRLPQSVKLQDLPNYRMVLPAAPNSMRDLVEALLRPLHVELDVVAEVGAVQTVLSLVAQGIGCTVLPEGAILLANPELALQSAHIGPPPVMLNMVLATPRAGSATRLLRETMSLLKETDLGPLKID